MWGHLGRRGVLGEATRGAVWRRSLSAAAPAVREVNLALFSAQAYMETTQVGPICEAFPGTRVLPVDLTPETAPLAEGCNAVSAFANDNLGRTTLMALKAVGVECIAMRCAGYDRVDIFAAEKLGITVLGVPNYNQYSIAEHSVALCLALNRQLIKAGGRVRLGNYSLSGLVGYDMFGKTVGLIGTGRIGCAAASIYRGMGCRVLGNDIEESAIALGLGVEYVDLDTLLRESQVVSLHCPPNERTRHMINYENLRKMRRDATLINVSRGELIDTQALVQALDNRAIAAVGLDVYEHENGSFFKDLSAGTDHIPGASLPVDWDDTLASLATRPNVMITPHEAFLTVEALGDIAQTTIANLREFASGGPYTNSNLYGQGTHQCYL